ncbi:MAG TPA: type II secretion system protein [Verrucomicrobiota bacterium]|nr:type II secretion system protein [Verrucomicrobiota bacterium]
MNIKVCGKKPDRAITRMEVVVIVCLVTALAVMLLPALARSGAKKKRSDCVNNLKTIGISYRVWNTGASGEFPMEVSTIWDGTFEYRETKEVFRHFQALSNTSIAPKHLICPADHARSPAASFDQLQNANLSYFVGLDANEVKPDRFLAGDRNLTNGTPSPNGILEIQPDTPVGWTAELHDKKGNVCLSDGSVQTWNTEQLREGLANSGVATNRLAMPW